MAEISEPPAPDDEPVPRIPRGRGLVLSGPAIIRIAMFVALLVAVIAMRRPCADNVAHFVGSFDPDAGPAAPPPSATIDLPPGDYVKLTPGMTDDEIRAAIGQSPPSPSPSRSVPVPALRPPR